MIKKIHNVSQNKPERNPLNKKNNAHTKPHPDHKKNSYGQNILIYKPDIFDAK